MPFLSILIPVYNAGQYLGETLPALLAELTAEMEVLLVDDGSSDDSLMLCRKFERENIRVFSGANAGPNAARNRALRESRGKYVTFLDADDAFAPGSPAALCRALQEKPCDLLLFSVQRIAPEGNSMLTEFSGRRELSGPELRNLWCMGDKSVAGFLCGKVYARSLFDGYSLPEDMRFAEDMFALSDLFRKVKSAVCFPQAVYRYLVRENTPASGMWTAEKSRQLMQAYLHRWQTAVSDELPLAEQLCAWGAAAGLYRAEMKLFPGADWLETRACLLRAEYGWKQLLFAQIPLRRKMGILKNYVFVKK